MHAWQKVNEDIILMVCLYQSQLRRKMYLSMKLSNIFIFIIKCQAMLDQLLDYDVSKICNEA
jgi:hypothetical protein